jgi:hypothetical protein
MNAKKAQELAMLERESSRLNWSMVIVFTCVVLTLSILQTVAGKGVDILVTSVLSYSQEL